MTRFGFIALLFVAGCAKGSPVPPIFIAGDNPPMPRECLAKPTQEPKLSETQDATDLDAVKDRVALKQAFRSERDLRKSCGGQLKILFPNSTGAKTS